MKKFSVALAALFVWLTLIAAPSFAQLDASQTWGGTSGGTANAQTVTIPNLGGSLPIGVPLRFIAGATNTGATTVNVSSIGATAVNKLTAAGPAALTGGEIVTGQFVEILYDGTRLLLVTPPVGIAPAVVPQGRLTLISATPVMSSDTTAATTIYYTPYVGNLIPVSNGTGWGMRAFSELTVALSSSQSSGNNYDVFVTDDAGTLRACVGPAWTSGTARGAGAGTAEISRLAGIWTNAVSMTCRYGASTVSVAASAGTYVGSFRATGSGQTTWLANPAAAAGGGNAQLYLWNMYNRVSVAAISQDSTDSWNYTTASFQSVNASTSNRISAIFGLNEEVSQLTYSVMSRAATGANNAYVGIGVDSTTTATGMKGGSGTDTSGPYDFLQAQYIGLAGQGQHFFQALEATAAAVGTRVWYGDNGLSLYQMALTYNGKM